MLPGCADPPMLRLTVCNWRAWRRTDAGGVRLHCAAAAAAAAASPPASPQRVAVIGGGFAGLAVSWHLLDAAHQAGQPTQLQLFDAVGLGAGGSGAAAGLLHPYTARGKMLWRGLEAFEAAAELLQAAEAAVAADAAAAAAAGIRQPFAWRHGMLRPARTAKQAADMARFLAADPSSAAATQAETVTNAAALVALMPGLQPELLLPPEPPKPAQPATAAAQRKRQAGRQPAQHPAAEPALGLMVRAGTTLHPASYMAALWLACQLAARQAGAGSAATLVQQPVTSLAALQAEQGPFDAVVVAAGAAVDSIAELAGRLPLDLCQGYSLDMRPGSVGGSSSSSGSGGSGGSDPSGGFPPGTPSLLGSPYVAAHGSSRAVVGATKRFGLTPAEAFAQLRRPVVHDATEAGAAAGELLPAAAQLWPPIAGWHVEAVRSGVRALPVRGADGAVPYAGRLPPWPRRSGTPRGSDSEPDAVERGCAAAAAAEPACWVIGGLGARGLVYHAWLGRLVARALLAGSDAGLPPELLRWKA